MTGGFLKEKYSGNNSREARAMDIDFCRYEMTASWGKNRYIFLFQESYERKWEESEKVSASYSKFWCSL